MKKPDPGSKACSLGILADLFDTLGGNSAEGFIKQLLPAFQVLYANTDIGFIPFLKSPYKAYLGFMPTFDQGGV